jgi:RNA polymerase sigma-70 factor, ECF subfamily
LSDTPNEKANPGGHAHHGEHTHHSDDAHHGDDADLTRTLVLQLRNGDAKAGMLLDSLYRARLIRFSGEYVHDRQEAEDVVQDVFLRVLASEVVPDSFRAWVYRIARNRCLDLLRMREHRGVPEELTPEAEPPAEATGNLTRLVRQEQRKYAVQALRALPLQQREPIRLRYEEDLSRTEIAQVLDLPESVVKSRIFEGLEILRKQAARLKGNA